MASASSSRRSGSTTDPTRRKPLPEIREEYEFYRNEWQDIRAAAADDMRYVSGHPFTEDDLDERGDRPTVAPDEMTQYRVQVTAGLRKVPRGAKFQPNGRGASARSAEFYQNKWREVEYRSHAVEHYLTAAENVLQRGYGAFRIDIQYTSPRAVNPDLVIEGFPDPDVVMPDPTHKLRTGLDMKGCFVLEKMRRTAFKKRWPGAEVTNFTDYADRYKDWVIAPRDIQVAEWWKVESYRRPLRSVVFSEPPAAGATFGTQPTRSKPIGLFEDEIALYLKARPGSTVIADREVRTVDYPKVVRRMTNGLEVLETETWPGKYIPIVMMYGPILYVPEGGQTKKHVISMTRFAKEPWKSYCYACSQELEVLGQVPKAAAVVYKGQLAGLEDQWEESLHTPKAFLEAHGRVPGMKETEERLPLPQRMEYTQAEYLVAIEQVKEGFRRAIQAAMGTNFLPTQAQAINDKSGKALEHIDDAASDGTYHFITTYEDGIKAGGIIGEDLMDKVHDYEGETSVISPKGEASIARLNTPDDPEAYSTAGDHLVTVTTGPSSDSEYDAVEKFLDHLVGSLGEIAGILGAPVAAYMLSMSIKMRPDLGVMGEELADAIMPVQFRQQGGKPLDPALVAAQQQIQSLTQKLQQLQNETAQKITLERVKGSIQKEIADLKARATSADKAADRAVKLDVAAIQAKIETMALLLEELQRIGGMNEDAARRLHEAGQATLERSHDSVERSKDRAHERMAQRADHQHAHQIAAAGAAADMAAQAQGATLDAARADQDANNQIAVARSTAPPEGAEEA